MEQKDNKSKKITFWVNIFDYGNGVIGVGPLLYQTKEKADWVYPCDHMVRIGCKQIEIEV